MQHVEYAVKVLGLIDGRDIGGLFYHTDQTLVARGAGAVGTRINIGDVVANGTKPQVGFHGANRLRQRFGIFVARTQYMECQPLCTLRANTRELFQLIDQARHGFSEF